MSDRPGRNGATEVPFRHILLATVTAAIADLMAPAEPVGRIPGALLTVVLVGALLRDAWREFSGEGGRIGALKRRWTGLAVLGVVTIFGVEKVTMGLGLQRADEGVFALTVAVFSVGVAAWSLLRSGAVARFVDSLRLRPPQTMLLSYLIGALLGALLLCLPQAVVSLEHVDMLDALFTSTSAICVTGLVVNNVGETYTYFGQAVILVLMQTGGFGIMFFAAFFVLIFTDSMGFRREEEIRSLMGADPLVPVGSILRRVIILSLSIEIAGAVLLFFQFSPEYRPLEAAWHGVFHSVSGFCNAGFGLFSDSLAGYAGDAGVNAVIAALFVLGSLGVPVLDDVIRWAGSRLRRGKRARLSLHSRIVLLASGILAVAGAVMLFALEYNGALKGLGTGGKMMAAVFHSLAARTAGFSTIDLSNCQPATLVGLMGLMFIGGAPVSTAGGLKITTVAILVFAFWGSLSGRGRVSAFGRTIPEAMTGKSLALLAAVFMVFLVLFELFIWVQPRGMLPAIFEMVSAFNTVGWSLGVTPQLNWMGKAVVIAAMLIGRIGPLTLAVALARSARPARFSYPTAKVYLG